MSTSDLNSSLKKLIDTAKKLEETLKKQPPPKLPEVPIPQKTTSTTTTSR